MFRLFDRRNLLVACDPSHGYVINAITRARNICRYACQPLPYCSNYLSRKDLFSWSKSLGLIYNEPDDICITTGRSMCRTPQSTSISDVDYRFLFVTCKTEDPFNLLSKLRFIMTLSSHDHWFPFVDGFLITYLYLWCPFPPLASLLYVFLESGLLPICPCPCMNQAAIALSNSTAIQQVFKRTAETVSSSLWCIANLLNDNSVHGDVQTTRLLALVESHSYCLDLLSNVSQVYWRGHGCDGIFRSGKQYQGFDVSLVTSFIAIAHVMLGLRSYSSEYQQVGLCCIPMLWSNIFSLVPRSRHW